MNASENTPQVFEDDSIDLIALLRQLYLSRWLIVKVAVVAAALGVVVALATPNTYSSGATFIPQTGGSKGASSSLSGLASLAGINLGGAAGGDDIPTTLYPQIVSSVPYKRALLNQYISPEPGAPTLSEYLSEAQQGSILGVLKKYTIGLPGVILGALRGAPEQVIAAEEGQIYRISEEDRKLFEALESKLLLSLNEKEGFVTLEFSDKDKFVAAEVAERAKELLQERIIEFKNQSARELLVFTTRQYEENRMVYERLQDSLAIFRDQNVNISSSLYQNRLDRLERELNIASSVAEQLASSVEQAKLQVNKDTPVFTVIEPVTVPFERSAPKRSLIVVIWTFLGIVLSTGYVLVREPAAEILSSIKKGEA
jgi:uncharacterized protein involved in exopolysaccharide biosynthesis